MQYDFDESVGHWICATSHAMRRCLDTELARENITLRQWEVLAWIALEGEQTQVQLAERLGIEAPTLAGILARMERDGWLERFPCAKDRRKKRIRVTERAEAVWSRMVECCRRVREKATDGIPDDDLQVLKRTCDQIRANLGSCGEGVPAAPCEAELAATSAAE